MFSKEEMSQKKLKSFHKGQHFMAKASQRTNESEKAFKMNKNCSLNFRVQRRHARQISKENVRWAEGGRYVAQLYCKHSSKKKIRTQEFPIQTLYITTVIIIFDQEKIV